MHIKTGDIRAEQKGRDAMSRFVQQNLDTGCAQICPEEGKGDANDRPR
jgi:hypothetical protein